MVATDYQRDDRGARASDAAARLVAQGGWPALSARRVGTEVGVSGNAINLRFPDPSLKKEVIRQAFARLLLAVESVDSTRRVTLRELITHIVAFLRADGEAPPLMVQVAALQAAPHAPFAGELELEVANAKAVVWRELVLTLGKIMPGPARTQDVRAEAIIAWYQMACLTLVTNASVSTPDLLRLTSCYHFLRDACHE